MSNTSKSAGEFTVDFAGEAYKIGLSSGGRVCGGMGDRSMGVYEESGDGCGVFQWRSDRETLPEDPDDVLEGSRLILILIK